MTETLDMGSNGSFIPLTCEVEGEGDERTVTFYDKNWPGRGYVARYYASTLMGLAPGLRRYGLVLHCGAPTKLTVTALNTRRLLARLGVR